MVAAASTATFSSETCQAVVSAGTSGINKIKSAMGFSTCDLQSVFDYRDSPKDVLINYTTLALTMGVLVLCTWKAGESANRYEWAAPWFWIPFTLVLFGMQIFADCSTNNVGISAVWSAHAGFLFLGLRKMRHTVWKYYICHRSTILALAVWVIVCVYYAAVEDMITSVAHLVAFGVGAGALLLFEALHQIEPTFLEVVSDVGYQTIRE